MNKQALEGLGKTIAASQGEALGPAVERARRRFMASDPSARRPAVRVWAMAGATLAAAVLLLFLGLRSGPSHPVAFDVGSSPGSVSQWVLVSSDDVPLRFSDGATVLLTAHAQGKVTELSPDGARVTLARGRARVSIPHRSGTRWTFDVGPFSVLVTGTRFDASWEPASEVFELDLQDGSVMVSGPTIVGQRAVVAGQHLQIAVAIGEESVPDATAQRLTATPSSAAPSSSSPSAPSSATVGPPMAIPSPTATGTALTPTRSSDRPTTRTGWRMLAADGHYADALVAAGPTFDAICAGSSAGDVIALADAARLAFDTARANRAYQAVRRRFPGSSESSLAAFALGRMASEGGNEAEAGQWFETCVRERADDHLRREALGRLMETRSRQGAEALAADLAAQYLTRYPDGPHAKLARKLKGE